LKLKQHLFFLLLIVVIFFQNCTKETSTESERVIVGITADVESLNPLFSFSGYETNIAEILYLGLVTHKWNDAKGELETFPMLAKSWQWNEDSSTITLQLRDDVQWTEGKKFTDDDDVF